jgi:ATP-binding cassette subfamily F protein 3
MIIVHLDQISFSYVTHPLLEGACWEIPAGSKIGLVGANGAGKSTLLRLIAGELAPEKGGIFRLRGARIGYLAQTPALDPQKTIWEEAFSGATELAAVEAELRRCEGRLGQPEVYNDETQLNRVLAAQARALARYEELGGPRYEGTVRATLAALGFAEGDYDQAIETLSGGQKKLVGLAKLMVRGVDLLLLDEPDNHLDLAGKALLERFISAFPGTVVIVSHDRYLLDETVTQIAEVEAGRVTVYAGNYSAFAIEKRLRLLRQQHQYEAQQKEIARIEAAIARFELWASLVCNERHARQARSRQKMLDRMERVERPALERRRMGLELEGWRGSNKVLEAVNVRKAFGQRLVLDRLNLLVWHGERVGLVGPNGAGKSVLLRCVLGQETPDEGEIKIGPSTTIGYYAQEHETLDPEKTLVEEIRQLKPMYEAQAVSFLGKFLFPYRMARQKVKELSGGERSRLQLAKFMLADVNFLLLDEPTNNLDLPSCEVLEEALDEFEGTVLVISHDRYFLNRVVDRIVELE